MLSPVVMSLGDRLCVSRKDVTGEGRWVHPEDETDWFCLGLGVESPWLALGWLVVLFAYMDLESSHFDLVGPPFLTFKACFQLECVGMPMRLD